MEKVNNKIMVINQSLISPKIEFTTNVKFKTLKSGTKSFYPIGNWKKQTNFNKQKSGSDSLFIFQLNQDLSTPFLQKKLKIINSFSPTEIYDFGVTVIQHIDCFETIRLRSCEIKLNPSRKHSTAYNLKTNEYMGLHIDTHDGITNIQRENAWRLISVNLGAADRYFHFVDLTFNQIVNSLGNKIKNQIANNSVSMFQVVQHFFEKYPNYPVNRIVLPSNYGYVARTQNLIHDGGTNWKGEIDVSILISGNFTIKKV